MKTFSRMCLVMLTAVLFTACSPAATPTPPVATENNSPVPPASQADNPYAPQPGDDNMMDGVVNIVSSSLSLTQSPSQATLDFNYFKPTPCFQLRLIVSQPDVQNRINVKAYAVAEKDKACTLMALATPLKASLDLGSFPKGHYSVWLNDVKVGEFDS